MSVRIWHYPNCSTCRKALKWLAAHEVAVDKTHIVASPPDVETLRDLWRRSELPLKKLFNTSGQSYRGGGWKDRWPTVTEDEALAALAADGKLIKRPLLDTGETVLVGFREASYAETFGAESVS